MIKTNPAPTMTKQPPLDPRIRIFIVDDHPVVREGLGQRISRQADMEICGEAEDVFAAYQLFCELKPDVAVVDIGLKTGNGLDLVQRIKQKHESARLLVWSIYSEHHYAERALRAGALGFISKGEPTERIIEAIRQVMDGKVFLSDTASQHLVQRAVGGTGPVPIRSAPLETLSDRELEVFRLLGQALDTKKIAGLMHVSPKTIETYQARIKEKLGIPNSRELFAYAVRSNAEIGIKC
jgi:DNA-binding NarL/FixJ family response regulator